MYIPNVASFFTAGLAMTGAFKRESTGGGTVVFCSRQAGERPSIFG